MMEELRDIKGFIEVPDESFLYFSLTLSLIGFLVALLVWFYVAQRKKRVRKVRLSPKALAKLRLKEIDFSNTKESVYTFSEAGQMVSPEHPALLKLLPKLEIYKFRREVPPLSEENQKEMKRIIKELTHE
jgi:uncharacterized membrane protein YgaE (UPF0421/DUF939 family)